MDLPKVTENQFKERLGVCAVERKLTEIKLIWRETRNTDVGIDGQIEVIDDNGFCTGRVVAAQVKSGSSFFSRRDEDFVYFTPEIKHRHYWSNFPVPVYLFVHNPDTDETLWIDARRFLRSPSNAGEPTIKIPNTNLLNSESRIQILESIGSFGEALLEVDGILKGLATQRINIGGNIISFLELFGLGLVDIGKKLFFSMNLLLNIAEYKSKSGQFFFPIGSAEYEFVNNYIRFLISQNLILYDFSEYLIDWEDREIVPIFITALSPRGQAVVCDLCDLRSGLFHEGIIEIDFKSAPPNFEVIEKLLIDLTQTKIAEQKGEPDC